MHKLRATLLTMMMLVCAVAFSAASEPVTIQLMSHYQAAHPHGLALQEYIAEYEALNPHITIEYMFVTNDVILDRTIVAAATDTLPDIVHIGGHMLAEMAEAGVIMPLSEEIVSDLSEAYLPGAMELTAYDGQYWGYLTEYMPRALLYNRNLFEAAGLVDETPQTWSDMRQAAAKLTETNQDGSFKVAGFGVGLSQAGQLGYGMLFSLAHPLGGRFVEADGRTLAFNSPEMAETLDYLRDLVTTGYANSKEWLIVDMKASAVGMMVAAGPYWKTEFAGLGPTFYEGMASGPVPVPEAGMTPAASAYGWMYAVTPTTEHPDEVYAFLNWLNTEVMEDGRTRMGNVLAHLGSIPVTSDDLRNQETIRDRFMSGFVAAVANNWTFPDPIVPNTSKVYRVLETALRESVHGVDSPTNALTHAEREIQVLLDEVYNR